MPQTTEESEDREDDMVGDEDQSTEMSSNE
jgi:hypothetical protein